METEIMWGKIKNKDKLTKPGHFLMYKEHVESAKISKIIKIFLKHI